MNLQRVETKTILFCKNISLPFARISLFILYFWFGILKVFGLSPASGVVERLFNETLSSFIAFDLFIVLFGLFECAIGVLFLVKGAERVVVPVMVAHLIMTSGPLVLLPGEIWTGFLVPTLEGQYIIKNLALLAVAIGIAAHLEPKKEAV